MITRRTKIQLLAFAIITLLGVTFVGARYAQLDRLFVDQTYTVVAHYPMSGGIFAGGEVTYRGVRIGEVSELELTDDGVDVYLEIDNEWDKIPEDTRALVGNRSALGEQYVELQPNVEVDGDGPFLDDDSEITDVAIPIATEKLLGDIAATVSSVDQDALRTTVEELGIAFNGTGEDLQRIIDTGNSFIETANENFDVTTALIRDSNTVLQTQIDSQSSLRQFANQLSIFSGAMVGADDDLRRVIDSGSFTANQLRTFLEQNEAEVSDLLKNVILTGRVAVANIDGFRSLLIAYPILLEGSFTVVDKNENTPNYETHVGLILTTTKPCHAGYESTDTRGPQKVDDRPLNQDAKCTEPPTQSNPRGYQNLPRVRPDLDGVPDGNETIIGTYDAETGTFEAGDGRTSPTKALAPSGNVAPPPLGEDSWKWLYLEPLLDTQG
ncbi:MlaD family protein [Nocardioides bizhenqiangii]|uniref:MlaD family protein n=1 Tax=Nocardioides bizhenqiangii TaxID=3095076 RepID=A0ABZ0ZUV2_9ACTN|nr:MULTISPECIES: MlaD family protein [unclassified Nocardioides]MDZ5622808.1 MlaD family protein [Nocardioides sp. HM23]WQQ27068.1 MlaD family protein [Nocardioides sp. HM61]